MAKEKEKIVVFQGTGYRVLRSDPRNLQLEVKNLNKDGKRSYQFKGYFGTIEQALGFLVNRELLSDETVVHDIKSFLKQMSQIKETTISDIKKYFNQEQPKSVYDDDLFN